MAKKLLIVEAPGKVKKLREILGSDWSVRASSGHIRELAKDGRDRLGFDILEDSIRCRYLPRGERGERIIKELQEAATRADIVYLGTDSDREGATIAWHLAEVLQLRQPERLVYTEITPEALRRAAAAPLPLDMNLVHAGLARACLDKLVGYRGSPLAWALNIGAASVGRVQSATLSILCDREREIVTFIPEQYFSISVRYQEGFTAYFLKDLAHSDPAPTEKTSDDQSKRVTDPRDAERIRLIGESQEHRVKAAERKRTHRSPPAPFTTSALQQAAGARLRFSPEHTMELAQRLYERGVITYHRTDAVTFAESFSTEARQWLAHHDGENLPSQVVKHRAPKGAQEAHEAIRPTTLTRSSATLKKELSQEEFDLYLLIWRRTVASFCRPAEVDRSTVITQSGTIEWQARGHVIAFPGYSRYWDDLLDDSTLPSVKVGDLLTPQKVSALRRETQPPSRYTESKLVKEMERTGIGRPSTYSPTIKTLKDREYVFLTDGKLIPSNRGLSLDAFLQRALPDLRKPSFTATMETALDTIAQGQDNWERYVSWWDRSVFAPALRTAHEIARSLSKTAVQRAAPPAAVD